MIRNSSGLIPASLFSKKIIVLPIELFRSGFVGIDEAGRGPLAGPVVVAAVLWRGDARAYASLFSGIKDSKKLSEKKREQWYAALTSHKRITWAAAVISAKKIDTLNIAQAANKGALRAYCKIVTLQRALPALLDGSLYLPSTIPHQVIIKGDEKIALVSAASIIAKVTRDRIMVHAHKKFSLWGFDAHKGYGTAHHRAMIRRFGISPLHRKSFSMGI